MIKIRIKNGDQEIDVRFPISEGELYAKLAEVHAIEGRDAPQSAFVTEVYWPEEFFMLKDRFANLDELNYLARRMESFDHNEYDQFLVGITKLESPTEKDLINLTFNLDHFTLCKDISSYGTIGRAYVLNTKPTKLTLQAGTTRTTPSCGARHGPTLPTTFWRETEARSVSTTAATPSAA